MAAREKQVPLICPVDFRQKGTLREVPREDQPGLYMNEADITICPEHNVYLVRPDVALGLQRQIRKGGKPDHGRVPR